MRVADKFTPEVLIEAPRRGPAVPNHDGTKALYTSSTHTIGGDTLKEARVMDISTGASHLLTDNSRAHDFTWLGTESVAYLESGEKGVTQLKISDFHFDEKSETLVQESYNVAEFPAPVILLKLKALDDGNVALAVVGRADSDGKLFNEQTEDKKSSVRVYDNFNVRYWDAYLKPQKYTIWYSRLVKIQEPATERWILGDPLTNLLQSNPEMEAPSGLNDGLADASNSFDLSEKGILFTAQDPENKTSLYKATTKVYFTRLHSWSGEHPPTAPREIPTYRDTSRGLHSNPRFSPDGTMVAFLKMSVERSQDNRLYVAELGRDADEGGARHGAGGGIDVCGMVTGQRWNLVPLGFEFAPDGHSLYLTAQDHGCVTLHRLKLQPNATPELVFRNGSVSGYRPLGGDGADRLLVSSSSFVESSLYQVVDGTGRSGAEVVSSASRNGAKLGLSAGQVSEIYFAGEGDYFVQAWVIRPRNFDETKKYPLCLHVHGGPESSWLNQWNTRWNAPVWAEQGYIVVLPNITGSVGFGLEYTERIYGQWGGLPYQDLEKCVEHLQDMPNLDLDHAVAAGGSYGGYMMLWMQGHALARKFKALVCHDGIFHLPSFLLECDLEDGAEEFKGLPYLWENPAELEKWNPARSDLLKRWKTPMLIVHSDKDYRVPVTEGLAAFNTCQALGVESRFVNFPDENHFVVKEENSLQWHREIFAWINRFSGVSTIGEGHE